MVSLANRSKPEASVTYIETDIDCHLCLRDVHSALAALPGVDGVTEDSRVGCVVVIHHTDPARLVEVVTRVGHRFDRADNGEVGMGSVIATQVHSCSHAGETPGSTKTTPDSMSAHQARGHP